MPPQRVLRAAAAPGKQHLPVLTADGLAAVCRCRAQQSVPLARLPKKLSGCQIFPRALVPAAKPPTGVRLRALRQKSEFPAQKLPQHMVISVDAGGAFGDECVVVRQIVQQHVRIRCLPNKGCLRGAEILCHTIIQQKQTLPLGKRLEHDLLDQRVHALRVKAPCAGLGIGAEDQIDHGDPALADGQKRLRLPLWKRQTAKSGILRKFLLRQPQIRRAKFKQTAAEAQLLCFGKDLVAREQEQMDLQRKPFGQKRDKFRCLAALQQMHIV